MWKLKLNLFVLLFAGAVSSAQVSVQLQNGLNGYTGCKDRELHYKGVPVFADTGIMLNEI